MKQKKIVSVANLQRDSYMYDDTDVDVDLTDAKINCSYFAWFCFKKRTEQC